MRAPFHVITPCLRFTTNRKIVYLFPSGAIVTSVFCSLRIGFLSVLALAESM